MEDFLNRISRDPSLREAATVRFDPISIKDSPSHMRVINTSDTLSVNSQLAPMSRQSVVYTSNLMNLQAGAADISSNYQSDSNDSSLAVLKHQFGSDPLAVRVH